MTKIVQRL